MSYKSHPGLKSDTIVENNTFKLTKRNITKKFHLFQCITKLTIERIGYNGKRTKSVIKQLSNIAIVYTTRSNRIDKIKYGFLPITLQIWNKPRIHTLKPHGFVAVPFCHYGKLLAQFVNSRTLIEFSHFCFHSFP